MPRPPIELPPHVKARALQLRRAGSSVRKIRAAIYKEHGLLVSRGWWHAELPRRGVPTPAAAPVVPIEAQIQRLVDAVRAREKADRYRLEGVCSAGRDEATDKELADAKAAIVRSCCGASSQPPTQQQARSTQ